MGKQTSSVRKCFKIVYTCKSPKINRAHFIFFYVIEQLVIAYEQLVIAFASQFLSI